jgi:hypothetical protein
MDGVSSSKGISRHRPFLTCQISEIGPPSTSSGYFWMCGATSGFAKSCLFQRLMNILSQQKHIRLRHQVPDIVNVKQVAQIGFVRLAPNTGSFADATLHLPKSIE